MENKKSRLHQAKEMRELSIDRIKRYEYLIVEYERIKAGQHERIRFVGEFYKLHNLDRKNFFKYYNRYRADHLNKLSLLPQKRGAKYRTRRASKEVEEKVIELRKNGLNKYEIHNKLKHELKAGYPSASGIYNIFKRYGINRLERIIVNKKKFKMVQKRPGELGHIDCHYLPKTLVRGEIKKRYLISLIDGYSRITYTEIIKDLKSLTVMMATLRLLNVFDMLHGIKFERIMSDNGSEFGGLKGSENREDNPFCRLLDEMGIKHTKIKPYRPQTNGKVERFWRTIHEELIDADYDTIEEFANELAEYTIYYNHERLHQALNGKTPVQMIE